MDCERYIGIFPHGGGGVVCCGLSSMQFEGDVLGLGLGES